MSRELLVRALGAVVGINGSALSPTDWARVRDAWKDVVVDHPAGAPVTTVIAHGTVATQTMLSALSTDVTLAALEARAGELLILHAAGLATADGHVVALVGASGRGKTTASRVLGREFGYVSDESVGIAADGAVLPYRKPLSLIENDHITKVQRSASELGLRPLPEAPLRLAALVLLERRDDVNPPTLDRVDVAEGIVGLAQQASYLGRMQSPLHTLAAHIEAVAGVHRLTYSDASSLRPFIERLGAHTPVAPRMQPRSHAFGAPAVVPQTSPGAGPNFQRVPVLDTMAVEGGRLALLVRDDERSTRVVVLDGIAPTLWYCTAQPASLAVLVRSAVAVHGDPGGGEAPALVASTVAALTDAGLLSRC